MLRLLVYVTLAVLFFPLPEAARAAGFNISEVASPASVGTAGVFNVVNDRGPSSAFSNPAGMTGLAEDQMLAGFQLAIPEIRFDPSIAEAGGSDGGNAGETVLIPGFFWVKGLSERWKFGLSLVAPLGGGVDYGDNFVGRYQTTDASLEGLAFSTSGGYRLNEKTSLGVGVSAVYQRYEQGIAINRLGLPDAKLDIEDATDVSFRPFFGLTHYFNDRLMLGFVYRAQMETKLEGDLKIKGGGTILNRLSSRIDEARLDYDLPDTARVGLRYQYNDTWTFFGDIAYEQWSDFSNNVIRLRGTAGGTVVETIERNWDDAWHIGFGFVRDLGNDRQLTFGVAYDESVVDDEDRTFDLPVDEQLKFALGYVKVNPNRVWSVGFTFIDAGDARIDQTAQGFRTKGKFEDNYILFLSGSIRWRKQ